MSISDIILFKFILLEKTRVKIPCEGENMKKVKMLLSVIMLATILTVGLCACQTEEYKIENHGWQFRMVQSSEDGRIIFCSEEYAELYPDAAIIEMTAKAENGKLTVTDGENEMTFTYSVEKAVAGKSTIYNIADEQGIEGYASMAKTTYADKSAEYTMIITFEGRSFYFTAPIK